jgi:hypothetical protein
MRQFTFADDILETRHLIGKHGCQQVLAAHALQLRRRLAAAAVARQGERGGCVPAPAHAEQRRIEQRLNQEMLGRVRMQIAPNFIERKAVAAGQRKNDGVLGGGRLQFEVEGTAKAFAQREAPGAIETAAKWRVNHELGAARFVEEALHDQRVLRRERAQGGAGARQIVDDLACGRLVEIERGGHPGNGAFEAGCIG